MEQQKRKEYYYSVLKLHIIILINDLSGTSLDKEKNNISKILTNFVSKLQDAKSTEEGEKIKKEFTMYLKGDFKNLLIILLNNEQDRIRFKDIRFRHKLLEELLRPPTTSSLAPSSPTHKSSDGGLSTIISAFV